MDGRFFEGLVLASFLCAAAVVDFRSGFIYDRLTAPMAVVACCFRLWDGSGFLALFWGLLAGGAPLFAMRVLSRGGLGGGDVKLAAAGGLWLGWQGALLSLALAAWSGGLAAICLLAAGKKKRRDSIVFGPFLAFGIGVAFFFGERLLAMYGAYCRG